MVLAHVLQIFQSARQVSLVGRVARTMGSAKVTPQIVNRSLSEFHGTNVIPCRRKDWRAIHDSTDSASISNAANFFRHCPVF